MWNVQINNVTEIDLECTTFCNLKCPECNRTTDKELIDSILNTTHITLEDCKNWFKPSELTRLREIRFCGAIDEALMNPELTAILDFFKDEFNIEFIDIRTNGSVRTPSYWANLVNHLPSDHLIVFGLDGLEDTNHIYRVGSDWKKIMRNAEAFIKAGGTASWQFIEFEHNKHQIDEARQIAKDMGFKEFRVVYSSRPTMSENLDHIRKNDKVSALSNRVPEEKKERVPVEKKKNKGLIVMDKTAELYQNLLQEKKTESHSKEKPKDNVQELVLVNRKKPKKEKTVIRCENQGHGNGNRILVNALAQVTPCCFLNGYFHQPHAYNKDENNKNKPPFTFFNDPILAKFFHSQTDENNDLTAISLKHNSLKEILAGKFFAGIQDSWTSKDPIERCLEVCGKGIVDANDYEEFEDVPSAIKVEIAQQKINEDK